MNKMDKWKVFFTRDIWRIRTTKLTRSKSLQINLLRSLIIAVRRFMDDQCQLKASALTFYTMLSTVPIAAMLFAVSRGFGMEEKLRERLLDEFSAHKEAMTYVFDFAQSLLEKTKTGLVAGIGTVVLFFTVVKVLSNIESSFNDIWGVKKARSIPRKFTDYLSFMLVTPILLIMSGSLTVFIASFLEEVSGKFEVGVYLMIFFFTMVKLAAYVIPWILFTFIYLFMPNTKVNFKSGILAGIIAGSIYQIFQWGYIKFQVGVASYNAIYGSFAAMPLFLVWLQLSWLTVLFGAELCFAHQNVETYEFEPDCKGLSPRTRKILSLLVCSRIVKNFCEMKKPETEEEISHGLDIPIRLVREIIFNLSEAGLIAELCENDKSSAYVPALPADKLTIAYVIGALDNKGSSELPFAKDDDMDKIGRCIRAMSQAIENSGNNIKLSEI